VAPRFLIDENLSPMLASYLSGTHGFDAVHVNDAGLRGAIDPVMLAYATADDRIVMTNNLEDFRKLARRAEAHPGRAVLLLVAAGRARQIELRTALAYAIDGRIAAGGTARGHLFEIGATGQLGVYRLP
jgi:predicted nuclease of predicted toxin-antitoxin system